MANCVLLTFSCKRECGEGEELKKQTRIWRNGGKLNWSQNKQNAFSENLDLRQCWCGDLNWADKKRNKRDKKTSKQCTVSCTN